MAIVNHFYNETTRKYVALFGTLFNQIKIERNTNAGAAVQSLIVPLSYGPAQKFLARITQDPQINRKSAINLPRMAFEITSMQYDGDRKIGTTQRIFKNAVEQSGQRPYMWAGAPYNLNMSLYIMTKYTEDATKIMEQIIPFFQPDWVTTVKLIPDMDPIDIPVILNSVATEELYEGSFEERQSVLYTLDFTLKGWYFGPERKKKVIKFLDINFAANTTATTFIEGIDIKPGLTANGEPVTLPTSNAELTAVVSNTEITSITINNGGLGYDQDNPPAITIAEPPEFTGVIDSRYGSGLGYAISDSNGNVTGSTGSGYTAGTYNLIGGTGRNATLTTTGGGAISGALTSISNGGFNYSVGDVLLIDGGDENAYVRVLATETANNDNQATATATIESDLGPITAITITDGGLGYTSVPTVTVEAPPNSSVPYQEIEFEDDWGVIKLVVDEE